MAELREEIRVKIGNDSKVLYEGGAENVKAFDNTHKTGNIIRIALLAAAGIILFVLYMTKTVNPNTLFGIILIVLFLYIGFAEVLGCMKFKKYNYYLTETHLISDMDTNVSIIPLNEISSYRYSKDADGHNSLVIGKIKGDGYKLRSLGSAPARFEEDGSCSEAVFYAVSNFEDFKKAFEQQMEKNKK